MKYIFKEKFIIRQDHFTYFIFLISVSETRLELKEAAMFVDWQAWKLPTEN